MGAKKTVQVVNVTRQTLVALEVKMADNPLTRLSGLMGKRGLSPSHGLWIVPCNNIHSCFMRFEFDAIFVDKNNTVLHLVEYMKPWGISKMVRGGRAVLELPGGTIASTGTEVGDQLEVRRPGDTRTPEVPERRKQER
jgi:hypothetical protein